MSREDPGTASGHPMDRRHVLLSGARALAGAAVARVVSAASIDERVIPEFRAAFERIRRAGLRMSPAQVLPSVTGHFTALCSYAGAAGGRYRSDLLLLASRFAEYAGWMSQESGDESGALNWTKRAVRFATAGGDHDMARYALVRRAELALYRHQAGATIELARRAQRDQPGQAAPRRILGLAARCEAQGHALNGDHSAFRRTLERSATLLLDAATGEPATGPVLGSTHPPDPISLVSGWSLYELGRPAEAAAILDREVPKILSTAHRPRTRFSIRQALAHAAGGEIEHACTLAQLALPATVQIDSATIRTDLRRLGHTLSRWRAHPPVRELYPTLTAALGETGTRG